MNELNDFDSVFYIKKSESNQNKFDVFFPEQNSNKPNLRESFIGSNISDKSLQEKKINQFQGFNWAIFILSILLLFFSISQLVYSRNQKLAFKSFFNLSEFKTYLNNFSIIRNPYIVSLLIIGLINLSLLLSIFIINDKVLFYETAHILSLKIFLLFSAYILIKFILLFFTEKFFSDKSLGTTYLSFETLSLSVIGIVLFPLIWALIVDRTNVLLMISISILGIILSLKIFNLARLLLQNSNFYLFQIILYLCTLEILPVLLLVKFVNQGFNLVL